MSLSCFRCLDFLSSSCLPSVLIAAAFPVVCTGVSLTRPPVVYLSGALRFVCFQFDIQHIGAAAASELID